MGLLTHQAARQARTESGNPVPWANLYVYHAGSDTMAPVYEDFHLTKSRANPVKADASGIFPPCHLIDGKYRIVVRNPQDRVLVEENPVTVATTVDGGTEAGVGTRLGIVREFETVQTLLSDSSLSYEETEALQTVLPGHRVSVSDGNFGYRVAPPEADDHHLITSGGVKMYVSPGKSGAIYAEAFGVEADTGSSQLSALQLAADFAASNGAGVLVLPRGTILIDGTLRLGSDTGFSALHLCGAAGAFIGRTRLQHAPGQTLNPLINVSGVRMLHISDVELRGNNLAPGEWTAGLSYTNGQFEDWVTPGCSTGRYNPYAAITFGALYGPDPGPDNGYTFGAYGTDRLASKVFLERVRIQSFVAGVVLAPNRETPGVEDILLRDCSLIENTFGVCTTGSQQRNVVVENCNILGSFCIFDNVTFGAKEGQPITASRNNFGRYVHLLQASNSIGQLYMSGNYNETGRGLGVLGTGNTGAVHGALFSGSKLDQIGQNDAGAESHKDVVTPVFMPTTFQGCSFVAMYHNLFQASETVVFDGCVFRSEAAASGASPTEQELFGVFTQRGGEHQITMRNCRMRSYSGLPKLLNDEEKLSALPVRALTARNTHTVMEVQTGRRFRVSRHPIDCRDVFIADLDYDGADALSFDITLADDRPMMVNDVLVWRAYVSSANDTRGNVTMVPALRVTEIAGTRVTCKVLTDIDRSYAPSTVEVLVQNFVNADEATGDTAVHSDQITNVSNIGNFRVGDWIATDDPDLPGILRITAISGTTLTMHRALNRTRTGVRMFNSRLIEI